MEFNFTTEFLLEGLKMMGIGMAGIFLVIGIIYAASLTLQKMFPDK